LFVAMFLTAVFLLIYRLYPAVIIIWKIYIY
jgi:hypothetical protein